MSRQTALPSLLPLLGLVLLATALALAATYTQLLALEARLRVTLLRDLEDRALQLTANGADAEALATALNASLDARGQVMLRPTEPDAGERPGGWRGTPLAPVVWSLLPAGTGHTFVLAKLTWRGTFACVGGRATAFFLMLVTGGGGLGVLLLALLDHRQLRPLTKRLQELSHQAQLSAGIEAFAHDVRKPFALVRQALDVCWGRGSSETSRQALAAALVPDVEASLRQVDQMIADVLTFGRTAPLLVQPATVEDLLEAALREVACMQAQAEIDITYRLRHARQLAVEPGPMTRVFANLLANAVEAMRGRGNIWIHSRDVRHAGGAAVEITFGNGGPAIAAAALGRLFEPFFTAGKSGGTGLGLAIVRRVLERHGGTVRVTSEAGAGTEFVLVLPAVGAILSRPRRDLPPTLARLTAALSPGGLLETTETLERRLRHLCAASSPAPVRLLVIDDDDTVRAAFPALLTSLATQVPLAEVVTAADWRSAQQHLKDGPFEAIICDFALADGDPNGLAILRQLRERGYAGRFLLHSNRQLAAVERDLLARLGDGFIPKPATRVRLLQLTIELLEARSRSSASSSSAFGAGCSASPGPTGMSNELADGKPRLVVIDDDCFAREIWQLRADEVRVLAFASPEQFLAAAAQDAALLTDVAAIVVDFYYGSASDMNGAALARHLRPLTAAPLILVSDLAADADRHPQGLFDGRLSKGDVSWDAIRTLAKGCRPAV